MADPLTMGLIMGGMGVTKYAGDVSANENANKLNAAASKWAPLLSVYGSKGMAETPRKSANLGADLVPAALLGAMAAASGGTPGGVPEGQAVVSATPGGVGPLAPGAGAYGTNMYGEGPIAAIRPYAGGGKVEKVMHEYKTGQLHSSAGPLVKDRKQAIAIAMSEAGKHKAAGGMMVPGQAPMPGDSKANDSVPIMASPGEAVVPRSVMANPNKWKVAAFLNEMKKHGPGPLPVKQSMNTRPPGKSSLSPWAAISKMKGTV